ASAHVLTDDEVVHGLANALTAVGVEGTVRSGGVGTLLPSPEVVTKAASDPQVTALEVGGDGWALTLPLDPGLAVGVTNGLDLASASVQRMLFGLFDACLADWAIAGPYDNVAVALRDYSVELGPGLLRPPPLGRFTWRGPDLLTDVEALAA